MEGYGYSASYAESGDSSPRSREIDFENPPPWEEQNSNSSKIKFMCSYGGKIHPRPNDNQLSYIGGETKILAVDRSTKFAGMISKLSALCNTDVCFKYQLPGEDLDALISVTNDDDLEHMMHEHDRLRALAKPVRLRLFLFPVAMPSNYEPIDVKSDRDQFVDALNSVMIQSSPPPSTVAPPPPPPNHVDFFLGLDKGMQPPVAVKVHNQIPEPAATEREIPHPHHPVEDRVIGPDQIQRQIQDFQRLHIEGQEQAVYRRRSDDQFVGGYPRDFYVQKIPEKLPPATVSVPAGYWPEKQVVSGGFPTTTMGTEQQVYMIPAPANVYPQHISRPVTAPTSQGYYAVQRMPPEVYREQPMYNVVQPGAAAPAPSAAPPTMTHQQPPPKMTAYSEGYGMVRAQAPAPSPAHSGGGVQETGYTQMAYDSAMGRQVYYTAPGGMSAPPQYQGMAVSADMRQAGVLSQEGKVVGAKVSQTSL